MNEFKNHIATLITDTETCTVIDWKNQNGSRDYWIRYILDKENGTLIITGDLGYSISCWHNSLDVCQIRKLVKNIPYWMSKFQCTTDDYEYKFEDIESDLNDIKEEYLDEMHVPDLEIEVERQFREMLGICAKLEFSSHMTYPRELTKLMKQYDSDWEESNFSRIGRRISPRVKLWSKGLIEALEQLEL